MKRTREILNELKAISPLVAEISDSMPFSVPDGYFDQFPVSMVGIVTLDSQNQTTDEQSTLIPPSNKQLPFSVPQGYFESFAANMIKLAKEEDEINLEIRRISAVVADIPKSNPFYLPENYFSSLALPAFVSEKKTSGARIINFNSWKKLAVAAAFTGLILTASIYFFNSKPSAQNTEDLTKFSVEAMEKFLTSDDPGLPLPPPPDTDDFSFALIDVNDNTISELLEGVGDNAIKEFMKENPVGDNPSSAN